MGVASGCGEQEVGVVLRRYIDFLILLIPTPLVSVLFCSSTIIIWFTPTHVFAYKGNTHEDI